MPTAVGPSVTPAAVSSGTVLRAKCIVVGESQVGKSSIVQMFHTDGVSFPSSYQFTAGVDVVTKTISVTNNPNPTIQPPLVELYIYDCSGRDVYFDSVQPFWANADMAMIVFDVTNQTSLELGSQWIDRVRTYVRSSGRSNILMTLVGNKIDVPPSRRLVEDEAGQAAATHMGCSVGYFPVSARQYDNVATPFVALADTYRQMYARKSTAVAQMVA